jgi:hypothetical protein
MSVQDALEVCASVIVSLGGGGAIVASMSNYLGKRWADRALETQRQENAKINLEFSHQLGLVTERARTALQIETLEHQIRFSRLYEKRARTIDGLHQRAREIGVKGACYVGTLGSAGSGAYDDVVQSVTGFHEFYEAGRIYLSAELETTVSAFVQAVVEPINEIAVLTDQGRAPHATLHENREEIMRAVRAATERVPALREELIKNFRAVLGGE